MVRAFPAKPLHFGLITQPTECCLPLSFANAVAVVTDPLKFGTPCSFHLWLGHALYHDSQWFHVYCFKEPADAQKFMERFGGEKFDPAARGRGANWARWKKGDNRA
jgi:hypothetical protein